MSPTVLLLPTPWAGFGWSHERGLGIQRKTHCGVHNLPPPTVTRDLILYKVGEVLWEEVLRVDPHVAPLSPPLPPPPVSSYFGQHLTWRWQWRCRQCRLCSLVWRFSTRHIVGRHWGTDNQWDMISWQAVLYITSNLINYESKWMNFLYDMSSLQKLTIATDISRLDIMWLLLSWYMKCVPKLN